MNTGGIYGGQPGQQEMGDFAMGMAGGAGRSVQLFRNTAVPTNVAPVVPAGLTAPSSAVVALFQMTPVVTGRFMYNFELAYTDSAADTVTGNVNIYHGVTSVSGGTVVGTPPAPSFVWESSAITVTGGSSVGNPSTSSSTFAAGNLTRNLNMQGIAISFSTMWLIFFITATHNLSAMSLSASCAEF